MTKQFCFPTKDDGGVEKRKAFCETTKQRIINEESNVKSFAVHVIHSVCFEFATAFCVRESRLPIDVLFKYNFCILYNFLSVNARFA